MKTARNDRGSLCTKLSRFLLNYRSTPHVTTGVSPAELFLGHCIRTRLDILRPDISAQLTQQQATQKNTHDRCSRERQFDVGQSVLVENVRGTPKWILGTIVEKTGPISYRVQVGDQLWRRHIDQLLEATDSFCSDSQEHTEESDEYGFVLPNEEQRTQNLEPQSRTTSEVDSQNTSNSYGLLPQESKEATRQVGPYFPVRGEGMWCMTVMSFCVILF